MPFITEEIWQKLPHTGESIMVSSFPQYDEALSFPSEEADVERVINAIRAIRARRTEMNVPPSKKAHVFIVSARKELFEQSATWFEKTASASAVTSMLPEEANIPDESTAVRIITADAQIYIPLNDIVDSEKEIARLKKELETATKERDRAAMKLANTDFVSRAPQKVIDAEKEKLAKYENVIAGILEALKVFEA
jgi:valyl-tRNA synthetase